MPCYPRNHYSYDGIFISDKNSGQKVKKKSFYATVQGNILQHLKLIEQLHTFNMPKLMIRDTRYGHTEGPTLII